MLLFEEEEEVAVVRSKEIFVFANSNQIFIRLEKRLILRSEFYIYSLIVIANSI